MAEDFDDHQGDETSLRLGGEVKEGFQDRSGTYPKPEYANNPDTNTRARSGSVKGGTNRGTKSARTTSRSSQINSASLNDPPTPSASRYPHNQVTQTASGHVLERDDTPGHERLNFEHRTGTKIEMAADGSLITRIERNRYTIIAGDDEVIIRGNVNIVIEGDANLRVQGDCNTQIDGDHNVLVQGNESIEIQGNRSVRVHGNDDLTVTGTSLRQTRGSVAEYNLSNYLERTVGTHTEEYGGNWKVTTQGSATIVSEGELQGSFYGGFLTLNGKNAAGDDGAGNFEATEFYGADYNGTNLYLTANFHIKGDSHVDGNLHTVGDGYFNGIVYCPTFEGTATRAGWATTAGTAVAGASTPTTISPQAATAASNGDEAPDSEETSTDVEETSDELVVNIDRQVLSEHNRRPLNTGEVVSKARNKSLRTNSTWLQDQVNSGAITTSISSANAPSSKRSATSNRVKSGTTRLGAKTLSGNFVGDIGSSLRINTVPTQFEITTPTRGTRLSPRFKISQMLAGDSDAAQLIDQVGLTKLQIAENMQLLSFNVLELIRYKYKDTWNISEGLYNLLPNEQIDSSSINSEFSQGLAVGIQFPDHPNSHYFDVASYIQENLVFDKLIISYIDYDPSGVNEPTLIISIKHGVNSKSVSTEFNHTTVSNTIQDLSG